MAWEYYSDDCQRNSVDRCKRIVWKNDELRGKNIETKRDVEEELRLEWWRNNLEKQSFVLERQRHEMLRYGTGLRRKGNELY